MKNAIRTQRVENGAIAVLVLTATIVALSSWWWVLFAAFLLFDLSALGYLRSTATGALWYNAVHSYTGPVILALAALIARASLPALATGALVIASAWAFHVAVDRALGYGLKYPDGFTHTHLGLIGRDRQPDSRPQ